MELTAYGHTFKDERGLSAYKKMKSEARTRAVARKKGMSDMDKQDSETQKHFAREAKYFKAKHFKL
jgi:hypothetical protein